MSLPLSNKVAVVTGGGRGIGRSESLGLAKLGARVVINDLRVNGQSAADDVVREIRAAGGQALTNSGDIGTWDGAQSIIDAALAEFGSLDIVVNNAGILRDRLLCNMSESEWDDVIRVHLKGTAALSSRALNHWRQAHKAGADVSGRIINTTSASGIYGQVGQSNYGAAKAGIAALTLITADEAARYGVTVNAIAPMALTGMTEGLRERTEEEKLLMAPDNIAPLVSWLASPAAAAITGQVLNIKGHHISVAEGWIAGPSIDRGAQWTYDDLTEQLPRIVREARGRTAMDGSRRQ